MLGRREKRRQWLGLCVRGEIVCENAELGGGLSTVFRGGLGIWQGREAIVQGSVVLFSRIVNEGYPQLAMNK